MKVNIFIPGIPRPGGSKKSFQHSKTGKIMTIDACKHNKDWRNTIAYFATMEYRENPTKNPVYLLLNFYMPRPKNHYGTGKNSSILKDTAPVLHTKKPDLTKLIRACEDALTGILWNDDSQIYCQEAYKIYCDTPGVKIEAWDEI